MTRASRSLQCHRGTSARASAVGSSAVRAHRAEPACDRGRVRDRQPVLLGRAQRASEEGRGGASPVGHVDWTVLCRIEIVNFSGLRRRLGVRRAGMLVDDVNRRIAAGSICYLQTVVGRNAVEFEMRAETREAALAQLQALAVALTAPLMIEGTAYEIDLVIAGASVPISMRDDVHLAEALDEAMARARIERRIVVCDQSAAADAFDRLTLSRELIGAAARGEMFLEYQPKLNIRRQKVTGVEALIRWRHPERGVIPPNDFIPIAEEARAIAQLTLWTLDQVVTDQKRLAATGHDLEIFVNISGQLLNDAAFIAEACARVRSAQGKIGFEITETSVIRDPDTAIAHLREIAAMGVPIAIDDYGAGLSSLAYLKQLPARELKIDKMFVMQLTSSNRDPLIVRSTIDLAHAMEMEVTAEGVETQAALALLGVMGCDMVQGFLISKPVPLDVLLKFLAAKPPIAAAPGNAFNQPASFWHRA